MKESGIQQVQRRYILISIIKWDYDESVRVMSVKVKEWKSVSLKKNTLTDEIVGELYEARKELDSRGNNQYSNVPFGTIQTWRKYLEDIGLAYRTVHRWLEHYEPAEQRLLTDDEYETKKQIEQRKKQDESTAIRKRIWEVKQTGSKPIDWDKKTEKAYQKQLIEDIEREKRIKQSKKEMQDIIEKREKEKLRREELYKGIKDNNNILQEATEVFLDDYKKKQSFKEKIKLSQSGKNDLFIDALMDYLEELEDNSRRIEACTNIIKVCRNISAELQVDK